MKKNKYHDKMVHFTVLLTLVISLIFLFSMQLHAKSVKTLNLKEDTIAQIKVSTKGTVLNFPTKPTNVILGNQGSFGLVYVENDIVVSPLSSFARSNIFIYLEGRRFSLEFLTTENDGDDIVLIRDELLSKAQVKFK